MLHTQRSIVGEHLDTMASRLASTSPRFLSAVAGTREDVWSDEGRRIYVFAKRSLDLIVVASLLVLLLPAFLVISLLIRLESPGPVLFRQPRIGWRGNTFTMLKFRTMKPDRRNTLKPDRRNAERPDHRTDRRQSFKSVGDPRVTPLGRFLRRSSLDELPQLINVLRGEMSLVGPRPEQVEMLRYYRPEHYRRHEAVPGLTGWWQVNGRCERGNRTRPEDDLARKLRDDEEYIKNRSFWFDVRILLLTVPVVLRQRGAC